MASCEPVVVAPESCDGARSALMIAGVLAAASGMASDVFCDNSQPRQEKRLRHPQSPETIKRLQESRVDLARNDLCACGSGKKYKRCCMRKVTE